MVFVDTVVTTQLTIAIQILHAQKLQCQILMIVSRVTPPTFQIVILLVLDHGTNIATTTTRSIFSTLFTSIFCDKKTIEFCICISIAIDISTRSGIVIKWTVLVDTVDNSQGTSAINICI